MEYKLNDKVFEQFPVLETERLLLRAFEEEDARVLFALRTNKRAIEFMDSKVPVSVEDSLKMIKDIQQLHCQKFYRLHLPGLSRF